MRRIVPALLAGVLMAAGGPSSAAERASDTFSRPDADTLGAAESGQRWAPMHLSSGQAWGIRSERAAFLPSGNGFIRYARLDTHSASPSTMRIAADITFSDVSAIAGLVVNLASGNHVFCKAERTPNPRQPYGFLAIGGRFDRGAEKSVLGTARSTFSAGERLTLGSRYHLVLARSGDDVTCSIAGTNANGDPVNESVHYTLDRRQANGLTSTYAGLRMRYVVGSGYSNEDDGGSRWDNIVVHDAG